MIKICGNFLVFFISYDKPKALLLLDKSIYPPFGMGLTQVCSFEKCWQGIQPRLGASEFYLGTESDPGGGSWLLLVSQRNMFLKGLRRCIAAVLIKLMRNCLKISRTTWSNRILHKYPVSRYQRFLTQISSKGEILPFSALATNSKMYDVLLFMMTSAQFCDVCSALQSLNNRWQWL